MNAEYFARRAEAIHGEMLSIDLERRPRVHLLILADDGTSRIFAHRWPVEIELPDHAFLPESAALTSARRDQLGRSIRAALLRSAAALVARTVANLPAASEGVRIVDARLEVIY